MEIYTPIISILLYITSLIAPADVTEISLAGDGQVMVLKKVGANHWKGKSEKGGILEYKWKDGVFTEQISGQTTKEKIEDHLALPLDTKKNPIVLKRSAQRIFIEQHEELLIFKLQAKNQPGSEVRVSWK